MKNKTNKIFSIAITAIMLLSVLVAMMPATAATGEDVEESELSPKSLKQDAIIELETINASKKSVQSQIDKSIWFINKSLDDKLWIDDWHLNSTTMLGAWVFNMEKAAIRKLEVAKRIDPTVGEELGPVIGKLTEADDMLATTAINDAKNTSVQNQEYQKIVDRHITKAEKEIEKAHRYREDKPALAINHFKLAWIHAQIAIKSAEIPELEVTTIEVFPSEVTLNVTETQQFIATAFDQYNATMPDVTFVWSSSNITVGTVNETGFFTALYTGTTLVNATADDVTGTATVIVA